MAKTIEKDTILINNIDTELKDLFARSETVNEENDEKLKELILKTEINDENAIVNYLPNTFNEKEKLAGAIDRIKKNKQNEKELDIETSKKREIEINDELKRKTFNENEDIELEEEIKKEKEESLKQNTQNRRENKIKNKHDSQNEKELDIETEKEIRFHEQQKTEQLEETKIPAQTTTNENKEKEAKDIIKEIIEKHDIKETDNISQNNTTPENISTDFKDNQWTIYRQENKNESNTTNHNINSKFAWEFNGILTIIDGNKTTVETFTRSGIEESFEKAKSNVLEAKNEFISMCEAIANKGDYNLSVRKSAPQQITKLYEEGTYKNQIQNTKEINKTNSKSFVDSLTSAKSENKSSNINYGRSIATESKLKHTTQFNSNSSKRNN